MPEDKGVESSVGEPGAVGPTGICAGNGGPDDGKTGDFDADCKEGGETPSEETFIMPSTSALRQGNIDEIQVSPGNDPLMDCLLQKRIKNAQFCGHPRCIGEAHLCVDLRCAERCPLVEHPVFVTAKVPDMLAGTGYGAVGIPQEKLMHCGKCFCNLQVTIQQMHMAGSVTCSSCGHVNKSRLGEAG